MYSLTIVEVSNQGVFIVGTFRGLCGRICSLPLLPSWQSQHSLACRYITLISTSVCTWLSSCPCPLLSLLFLREWESYMIKAHSTPVFISTHILIIFAKIQFPNRVTFTDNRGLGLGHTFWFQPTTMALSNFTIFISIAVWSIISLVSCVSIEILFYCN